MVDEDIAKLVEARWTSSSEVWEKINRIYKANTSIYANESGWIDDLPYLRQKWIVRANRIFVNMEAVINSLIANPPGINILPGRDGETAQEFARKLESYFKSKFIDLNVKETMRKGYRNLYFGRLIVIKPFWNPTINDFDFRSIDPNKVRFGKNSTKEQDTEFAIEEIDDNLCAVIERFPEKKDELMKKYGMKDDTQLYITNPDVTYKEAWIGDYVIFKIDNIILAKIRNPYWDWDGMLITEDEEMQLGNGEGSLEGEKRRQLIQNIKLEQDQRKQEMIAPVSEGGEVPLEQPQQKYKQHFFNYFENPRKAYIFGTIFNNENTPIGRTD
ncbi:MAG TPA: hypothetical protein VIY47_17370, partial [Ignavibacteriaceae bacterium]